MTTSQVVLITGGARRLGRAMAQDLAAHGYSIAIHYRSSAAEADELVGELHSRGSQAQAFCADLASETACESLVPAVVAHFGRLDAVVNNASLFEYDHVGTFSYASMDAHWRANTAPAVVLSRALARQADAQTSQACVVNILDQKLWNPDPDYLSYTLSKTALECCTDLLARALAPRVRVCGVAPGVTLPSDAMSTDDFQRAHQMTLLRRSSTPQDIARAVRFLIESPAITGTTLLVDGGQHMTPTGRDVLFLVSPSAHKGA